MTVLFRSLRREWAVICRKVDIDYRRDAPVMLPDRACRGRNSCYAIIALFAQEEGVVGAALAAKEGWD